MKARRAARTVKSSIHHAAIDPFSLKITFYGVRGSDVTTDPNMGKFGQDTSCLLIEAAGQLLIFDTGSGFRKASEDYLARFKNELPPVTIFMSHFHKDHMCGMHVAPIMFNGAIPKTVWGGDYKQNDNGGYYLASDIGTIHAREFSEPTSPNLAALHVAKGRTEFKSWEVPHNIMNLTKDNLHPLVVKTCAIPHGQNNFCIGYRVETHEGIVCLLTDFDMTLEKLKNYPELVEFVRAADLLIADGMYNEAELQGEPYKKLFGHGTAEAIIELAAQSNVKDVCITHHDVTATDDNLADKENHYQRYGHLRNVNVSLSRQGNVITKSFVDRSLARIAAPVL